MRMTEFDHVGLLINIDVKRRRQSLAPSFGVILLPLSAEKGTNDSHHTTKTHLQQISIIHTPKNARKGPSAKGPRRMKRHSRHGYSF